jgi:hypothetical protein
MNISLWLFALNATYFCSHRRDARDAGIPLATGTPKFRTTTWKPRPVSIQPCQYATHMIETNEFLLQSQIGADALIAQVVVKASFVFA